MGDAPTNSRFARRRPRVAPPDLSPRCARTLPPHRLRSPICRPGELLRLVLVPPLHLEVGAGQCIVHPTVLVRPFHGQHPGSGVDVALAPWTIAGPPVARPGGAVGDAAVLRSPPVHEPERVLVPVPESVSDARGSGPVRRDGPGDGAVDRMAPRIGAVVPLGSGPTTAANPLPGAPGAVSGVDRGNRPRGRRRVVPVHLAV